MIDKKIQPPRAAMEKLAEEGDKEVEVSSFRFVDRLLEYADTVGVSGSVAKAVQFSRDRVPFVPFVLDTAESTLKPLVKSHEATLRQVDAIAFSRLDAVEKRALSIHEKTVVPLVTRLFTVVTSYAERVQSIAPAATGKSKAYLVRANKLRSDFIDLATKLRNRAAQNVWEARSELLAMLESLRSRAQKLADPVEGLLTDLVNVVKGLVGTPTSGTSAASKPENKTSGAQDDAKLVEMNTITEEGHAAVEKEEPSDDQDALAELEKEQLELDASTRNNSMNSFDMNSSSEAIPSSPSHGHKKNKHKRQKGKKHDKQPTMPPEARKESDPSSSSEECSIESSEARVAAILEKVERLNEAVHDTEDHIRAEATAHDHLNESYAEAAKH
jgi:hypothetical protein